MCVVVTTASATPDNFLLTFDKDLHTFGARSKCKDVGIVKASRVKHDIKPPQDFFDDYDHAEHDIFHHVENAEKSILTAAGHLIRDEANYLFSDHDHKKETETKDNHEQVQRGGRRRRGSSDSSKDKKKVKGVNAQKEGTLTEHEKKHAWFERMLNDYIENDFE